MGFPGESVLVTDGGLATELEARGNDLSDALWSARLLADAPQEIVAAHRAFFAAGADIAITASYQASFDGFAARGIGTAEAARLMRRSVELAAIARAEVAAPDGVAAVGRDGVGADRRDGFAADQRDGGAADQRDGFAADQRDGVAADQRDGVAADQRDGVAADQRDGVAADQRDGVAADQRDGVAADGRVRWVAASVGPYGAVLADGSEYRGRYGKSVAWLRDWHRPRLEVLASAGADVLALETVPDADEGAALAEAVAGLGMPAWLSYSIAGDRTRAGQPLAEAFAVAAGTAEIVAVGVNCCDPADIPYAITVARETTGKPVIVYPNSGEGWDATARRWTGPATGPTGQASPSGQASQASQAAAWLAGGARIIGGCCRVGPSQIQELSALVH